MCLWPTEEVLYLERQIIMMKWKRCAIVLAFSEDPQNPNNLQLICFLLVLAWKKNEKKIEIPGDLLSCDVTRLGIPVNHWLNTLKPRQNGRRFADDTFKRIFLNENVRISIKISLKFVPKGPINNNPALVQIMAWRWSGDKPLSEPMMVSLLTHICVTRPQWVNMLSGSVSPGTLFRAAKMLSIL